MIDSRPPVVPYKHFKKCKEVQKPASYLASRVFYCSTICNEIQADIVEIVSFSVLSYKRTLNINKSAAYRVPERLEHQLIIKLGDMMVTAIAVVAILMKIL